MSILGTSKSGDGYFTTVTRLRSLADPRQRVSSLFTAILVVPLVGADLFCRVGCHPERVVLCIQFAGLDGLAFCHDGLQRIHEAVQFGERFTLGGLDHQRFVHREGEGRCVESEVHQTLGHVGCIHAVFRLEGAQVDDALVCHVAFGAGVERPQLRQQFGGHIVGVEDGDF